LRGNALSSRDAVDLDVKTSWPRRNADKNPGRWVLRTGCTTDIIGSAARPFVRRRSNDWNVERRRRVSLPRERLFDAAFSQAAPRCAQL